MELFKCGPRKCPQGQMTGDCVFYTGPNLPNGIKNGDSFNDIVQKLTDLIGGCTSIGITSLSSSQSITIGNSAILTVVATGTSPTYQWYKGGSAISGATNSSYTISNAQSTDAGTYYVVVSNTCSTKTSSNIVITVTAQPSTLSASLYYGTTDPTADINAGNFPTPTSTTTVTSGASSLSLSIEGAPAFQWYAVEWDASLGDFTKWSVDEDNYGTLDGTDSVFSDIITVGSKKYIVSLRGTITFNSGTGTKLTLSK